MSETWFSSDHHFGHERIIELCDRPFRDVAHMNEEIIERHNAVVEPEDLVYFLGDVALGKRVETLPLVARMNGRKVLVAGNHDSCWGGHRKMRMRDVEMYFDLAGFESILSGPTLVDGVPTVPGFREAIAPLPDWPHPVALSHLPHSGDSHGEDRHAGFRPPRHADMWRVCGHVHTAWKVYDRQVNVGVDVWDFAPVHSSQLVSIMNGDVEA